MFPYALQAGVSTVCDYDQPLNNFGVIATSVLYDTDGVGNEVVTATLAITVEDDVTLLYVGYTDGDEHFLAAVSTCTCIPQQKRNCKMDIFIVI